MNKDNEMGRSLSPESTPQSARVSSPPTCACGKNLNIWQNQWNHEQGCPMTPIARALSGIDTAKEAMRAVRLDLAVRRDSMPTESEHAAMLDVYEEFGR